MEEDRILTVNHKEIQNWAERFEGCPEIIYEPGTKVAIGLRINFPGKGDDLFLSNNHATDEISWDDFFREFESLSLAFEYKDKEIIDPSASYMFVKREMEGLG